jgi:hypothetical protein
MIKWKEETNKNWSFVAFVLFSDLKVSSYYLELALFLTKNLGAIICLTCYMSFISGNFPHL